MENRILFLGPVGSGKTCAIHTISDIEAVNTDVLAEGEEARLKATTTVAMDLGVLELDGADRVVLYGAPGQDRFDFMQDILLDQCDGVVLLLNHAADNPLNDLDRYWHHLHGHRSLIVPLVIGVTHSDRMPERPVSIYNEHLLGLRANTPKVVPMPPVLTMDARRHYDVRAALVTLVAVLEMAQRYPA
jgi:signal recognition particle receptor subunit beta